MSRALVVACVWWMGWVAHFASAGSAAAMWAAGVGSLLVCAIAAVVP